MKLFRISELKRFLDQHGLAAKKSLSQNFLIDGNILEKIALLANITPGDRVLEIGPGPGALTERLIEKGATVVAIEKDSAFAALLSTWQGTQLSVIEGDALSCNYKTILPQPPYKVVANLPYSITTPLLAHLIDAKELFSSITVMVQKEVAERICAQEGSKEYSSLSVFLRYYTDVRYGFTVSRTCFYPAPSVDSAIIHLIPKQTVPLAPEIELLFFQVVRAGFGKRRKQLQSVLRDHFPREVLHTCWESLSLSSTCRIEELPFSTLIDLAKKIYQQTHPKAE